MPTSQNILIYIYIYWYIFFFNIINYVCIEPYMQALLPECSVAKNSLPECSVAKNSLAECSVAEKFLEVCLVTENSLLQNVQSSTLGCRMHFFLGREQNQYNYRWNRSSSSTTAAATRPKGVSTEAAIRPAAKKTAAATRSAASTAAATRSAITDHLCKTMRPEKMKQTANKLRVAVSVQCLSVQLQCSACQYSCSAVLVSAVAVQCQSVQLQRSACQCSCSAVPVSTVAVQCLSVQLQCSASQYSCSAVPVSTLAVQNANFSGAERSDSWPLRPDKIHRVNLRLWPTPSWTRGQQLLLSFRSQRSHLGLAEVLEASREISICELQRCGHTRTDETLQRLRQVERLLSHLRPCCREAVSLVDADTKLCRELLCGPGVDNAIYVGRGLRHHWEFLEQSRIGRSCLPPGSHQLPCRLSCFSLVQTAIVEVALIRDPLARFRNVVETTVSAVNNQKTWQDHSFYRLLLSSGIRLGTQIQNSLPSLIRPPVTVQRTLPQSSFLPLSTHVSFRLQHCHLDQSLTSVAVRQSRFMVHLQSLSKSRLLNRLELPWGEQFLFCPHFHP